MGTKQLIGALGEDFVAKYLVSRNYEILDRNWRIREGEIDLVAISEHGVVVFVEVKTRTNSAFGHPLEAIFGGKSTKVPKVAILSPKLRLSQRCLTNSRQWELMWQAVLRSIAKTLKNTSRVNS